MLISKKTFYRLFLDKTETELLLAALSEYVDRCIEEAQTEEARDARMLRDRLKAELDD